MYTMPAPHGDHTAPPSSSKEEEEGEKYGSATAGTTPGQAQGGAVPSPQEVNVVETDGNAFPSGPSTTSVSLRTSFATAGGVGPYNAALLPRRVESRLVTGQGGRVLSSSDLSEHALAEVAAADLPRQSLADGPGGEGRRNEGDTRPLRFMSDADLLELEDTDDAHEPVRAADEPLENASEEAELQQEVGKKEVKAPYGWPSLQRFPRWYLSRLTGFDQSQDVFGFYPSFDQLVAAVFTCFTLVVLGLLHNYGFYPLLNHTLSAFIPAFGATSTVVYAVPKAAIAQPRNVVFAHVTAAIIGTALTNAFRSVSEQPFGQHCAGALGVGLHLALMQCTNTMHPPASATVISAATATINAYYKDEGFLFVITPVLLDSIIVLIIAWLLNNLVASRSPYPQYW